MMHTTDRGGYYRYTIYGRTFYVPRIGTIPVIGDYDFSCLPGQMLDNYKALEQEWYTPTYSLGTRENQAADLWGIVASIRYFYSHSTGFERWIEEELAAFFGSRQQLQSTANHSRPMPGTARRSVRDVILKSALFEDFGELPILDEETRVHETYNADVSAEELARIEEHLQECARWKPEDEFPGTPGTSGSGKFIRYCPFIFPRNLAPVSAMSAHSAVENPYNFLPSQLFYLTASPADKTIDGERAILYSPLDVQRAFYEDMLSQLYDDPDFDFPTTATAEEEDDATREEFASLVLEIANAFLTKYAVPQRWWAATLTCAWMDAAHELQLFAPGAKVWSICDWCVFWDNLYSEMQLLHFFMQWSWLRK